MPKFRKKPVVIDAHRWDGDAMELAKWAHHLSVESTIQVNHSTVPPGVIIQTLEGDMKAGAGDWIIRGVKGELYPCKPDIFEATYEKVD